MLPHPFAQTDFHRFIGFGHRLGDIVQVMSLTKGVVGLWKNLAYGWYQPPLLTSGRISWPNKVPAPNNSRMAATEIRMAL